ncbi:hypothetical protein ACIGFK_34100 [Streptomyces sp. NPDC085524]|uniref:hypothetical protein n=1 Tax=Streptomyces sp. NPDC085524 TaxID=3365728 RepID=UPI0037D63412
MELWDQKMDSYTQSLERLESAELANIAFDAIEAMIPLLGLPLDEFFPPSRAALIESTLHFRHDRPADWHLDYEFAQNFLAKCDELPNVALRPAVGPFFMALVRLFEAPPRSASADDAMEILSSCYESVLMSQLTGRVTLEDERNSSPCVAAIDQQIKIIGAALR